MSDPLVQLWLYNDWANGLLIAKMKKEAERLPANCLRLLSHIMNAQLIWLYRLNSQPSPVGVWDEHSLVKREHYHQLASTGLGIKIKEYNTRASEVVSYQNTKHEHFQNLYGDLLLHVLNHGTYHRAQIATEMRNNGIEPINTDYISFVRNRERPRLT